MGAEFQIVKMKQDDCEDGCLHRYITLAHNPLRLSFLM